MVNFIILGALVLLLLVFLRAKGTKHKIYSVLVILLLIFLYTTSSKVISEHNLNIKTFDGMISAGKFYFSWLGQAFQNSKVLVGNAIKMDWAVNSTLK